MNDTPYRRPAVDGHGPDRGSLFVLAGIGSALASLYWGALTLLIFLGVAAGSVSGMQLILPLVLIGLYAVRAFQVFKGDRNAAQRLLWLHGFGGAMALVQIVSGGPTLIVLQGIKIVIHVFGGVTAYLAQRR